MIIKCSIKKANQSESLQHKYIYQPPDSAGMMCRGYYLDSGQKFAGFINNNEIKFIEEYKYSDSRTFSILFFGGIIAVISILLFVFKPPIGGT